MEERSGELIRVYLQRLPSELREKVESLPPRQQMEIIKILHQFHQSVEEEAYQLVLRLIKALSTG